MTKTQNQRKMSKSTKPEHKKQSGQSKFGTEPQSTVPDHLQAAPAHLLTNIRSLSSSKIRGEKVQKTWRPQKTTKVDDFCGKVRPQKERPSLKLSGG